MECNDTDLRDSYIKNRGQLEALWTESKRFENFSLNRTYAEIE